jgi:hypothetical protein
MVAIMTRRKQPMNLASIRDYFIKYMAGGRVPSIRLGS